MLKSRLLLACLASCLLALSSCTFNNIVEDVEIDTPPVLGLCDSLPASFNADVLPIIQLSCSDPSFGQCHAAGSPRGDFTSYAGIKAKVDAIDGASNQSRFKIRVLNVKDMPPPFSTGPDTLTPQQLDVLACWFEAGALDN